MSARGVLYGGMVVWRVRGWDERTYNRMKKKREGRRVDEILCVRWTLGAGARTDWEYGRYPALD